jgi:murein DD-endopeptidase
MKSGFMGGIDRRAWLSVLAGSIAGSAFAQDPAKPTTPPRPIDAPIDVAVPVPPTAFRGDGKMHLVYEVHLTNFAHPEILLTRFEVLAGDRPLATFAGDDFARIVTRPAVQTKEPLRIEGGLRAVIFVWVTLDSVADVPASLDHRITLKVADDEFTSTCARIPVLKDPVSISPPLKGDGWCAANGPANGSGHRRSLIPVGGGVHIAQRFAIDWLQLRDEGGSFKGDCLDNKNYRCYGSDVLAVADATVVTVKDGIPQNVPGINSRAVPITLETVGGNHVILDLGRGHFAFYAHLQPGQIRVKVGDRVKHGQVMALLGNSGNSTEPHLHFHICNLNSPLAAEGLPYAVNFEVMGKGMAWKPSGAAAERRTQEMPLQNTVLRFL